MVHCAHSDVPELHRLARTLDTWHDELLAYFDTGGVSNGPTEATNLSAYYLMCRSPYDLTCRSVSAS